jgi:uncharacterized protein DUF1579
MNVRGALVGCAIAGVVVCTSIGLAQEKKPAAPAGGDMMVPKPGPEQAILKTREGNWDATVKSRMAPGEKETVSKGSQTNTLGAGLWLVSDYKGDFMGMPFWGHGITGYDAIKKKYTLVWVDGWTVAMLHGEGTADAAGKTLTFDIEGFDSTGKPMKYKQIEELKDPDTLVMTMMQKGADGKDFAMMTIEYKRKK